MQEEEKEFSVREDLLWDTKGHIGKDDFIRRWGEKYSRAYL